jgi:hypothetical protein
MGEEGKNGHPAKPDATITESRTGRKSPRSKSSVALAEPGETESVPMRAFIAEEFKEIFVEIYHQDEESNLVTCIEVLSPSNKRAGTEGWDQYERKRQALLLGRANFVEIDLLRSGRKMPMLDPWPDAPYTLLVSRMAGDGHCRVWPAHYKRTLPPIPVPLVSPDPPLTLDLQPLIDAIYALGRYHERLDYTRKLTPALSDAEAAWVKNVLKDHTPRPARKGGKSSRRGN